MEVCPNAIHLVDEAEARHVVLVGLAPHSLGLRLYASHSIEDRHRAVQYAQRPLNLYGEVDVARSVDDVDPVVGPEACRRGGGNSNSALLLLDHPVHGRRTLVNFADLVVLTGVVEDPLRGRGLAGIDVSHDADVSNFL